MKLQLCQFIRKYDPNIILKKDLKWENGVACVDDFNSGSADYIIDASGNKLMSLWKYKLVQTYALGYLDTDNAHITGYI